MNVYFRRWPILVVIEFKFWKTSLMSCMIFHKFILETLKFKLIKYLKIYKLTGGASVENSEEAYSGFETIDWVSIFSFVSISFTLSIVGTVVDVFNPKCQFLWFLSLISMRFYHFFEKSLFFYVIKALIFCKLNNNS